MNTGRFVFPGQPVKSCISRDMSKALPMCGRNPSRLFILAVTGKHTGSVLLWQSQGNVRDVGKSRELQAVAYAVPVTSSYKIMGDCGIILPSQRTVSG